MTQEQYQKIRLNNFAYSVGRAELERDLQSKYPQASEIIVPKNRRDPEQHAGFALINLKAHEVQDALNELENDQTIMHDRAIRGKVYEQRPRYSDVERSNEEQQHGEGQQQHSSYPVKNRSEHNDRRRPHNENSNGAPREYRDRNAPREPRTPVVYEQDPVSLFASKLPVDFSEDEARALFSAAGSVNIEAVDIKPNARIAFITYGSQDDSEAALNYFKQTQDTSDANAIQLARKENRPLRTFRGYNSYRRGPRNDNRERKSHHDVPEMNQQFERLTSSN